jgi:hypothetical protein
MAREPHRLATRYFSVRRQTKIIGEVIFMKRNAILAFASIVILLSCGHRAALAQTDELQKVEIGAHFTSLSLDNNFETNTEPGFGGRFTYNVTRNFAVEAEGNFFPKENRLSFRTGGRAIQGLFGIKLGKRYKRFGFFGKARPGFISYSQGLFEFVPTTPTFDPSAQILTRTERLTHFAADIGGVIEFYPSRRIFTRIDAGDTIIRMGQTRVNNLTVDAGNQFVIVPLTVPGDTTHNFQFSAGVGFRF